MSKADLVEVAAKAAGISKTAAAEAINAAMDAVVSNVAKGNRVTLVGFGSFESRKRKARTGKNPATGASIKIPARTVPAFSAGQAFKDAVGKKK
ncbi:MAG TPA: HU family DNA-binding protein [Pelomicrobium sp.]|nr:HU family DNA-binding protein [Pelomicrobium sp.]